MKLTWIFKLIIEPDKNTSSKAPQTAVLLPCTKQLLNVPVKSKLQHPPHPCPPGKPRAFDAFSYLFIYLFIKDLYKQYQCKNNRT